MSCNCFVFVLAVICGRKFAVRIVFNLLNKDDQTVNSYWTRHLTLGLLASIVVAAPTRASAQSSRSMMMNQARQSYQLQMKMQAEEQKALELAAQKAAAAEAAEEKRKRDNHAKANRARLEKEAKRREAAIARMKAENVGKDTANGSKGSATKPTLVKNPQ
jgi:septal ring factor EnvC (AmiA/AmiB activator)